MTLRRTVAALAISVATFTGTTASAALIDLGFSLDGSGSVGFSNFATTQAALASALAVIPTSGANEYRVAITTFSDSSATIVVPTIVTAANLATIQASVVAAGYAGSGTNTGGAIRDLAALFKNSAGGYGATTLLNFTTDGVPNDQFDAELAASEVFADGVDGISFEAVGSGISSASALANMAMIAGPGTGVVVTDLTKIPNATVTGFVIPVSDFDGYSAAIAAKIGQIVTDTGGDPDTPSNPNVPAVPLPAALPLLLGGLGILGVFRARRTRATA